MLLRRAISCLVDAFLENRDLNVRCFEQAHELGAQLQRETDCLWTYDATAGVYANRCPIFALHQIWATSVAWENRTSCSICGGAPFECDHVPGEWYTGQLCGIVGDEVVGMGHVALTADPDFVAMWHQPVEVKAGQLVQQRLIARPGDTAHCTHCTVCVGIPDAGDRDPVRRWRERVEQARPDA